MTAERIATITLDDDGIKTRSPEVEHERTIAMVDLLHDNRFAPANLKDGPYDVALAIEEGRLVFTLKGKTQAQARVVLPVSPFKHIVRDYFLICESYYDAIKKGGRGKIEAVDAGRRGLHNEGAEMLKQLLADKIAVDTPTARRLFTLLCVLHIRQ